MSAKIDGVLEAVGALGRFQWIHLFISCGAYSLSSFHFIGIVFHSITPNFRCALPGWTNDSYTIHNDLHNQSVYQWIPLDEDGKLDSCKLFTNATNRVDILECDNFVFDNSEYWGNALNMHFNMVCSRTKIGTNIKVVFTTGLVVGAAVVGMLGDRFGRRPTLIGTMLLGGITGIVTMFSVNVYMFAALRFVTAGCLVGAVLIAHTITMETIGPSRRTYGIAFRSIAWPSGTMLTSLIAYYCQDWNWFQLAISIPAVVFALILTVVLKETPHFLVTRGRHEEAEALFKHIARLNGRNVPDNMMEDLKEDEEAAVSEKLVTIFKAPVLLKRTFVFFYLWFIAGLGFYGLGFNVSNLTGDVYINNVISGAAELPTSLFALLSKKLGRKIPMMLSLFVGSLALVSSALMTVYLDLDTYGYAMIAVSMVGKLGISNVFMFDYFWSSEQFPSTLRTSLVGLCSLCARVGSILSPVIVDLHKDVQTVFGTSLGALIFGITMFIGGVLTFYLPETNKHKMPETIAEANDFTGKKTPEGGDGDEKFNASSTADLIDEKATEL